jgi:hypothetical protein
LLSLHSAYQLWRLLFDTGRSRHRCTATLLANQVKVTETVRFSTLPTAGSDLRHSLPSPPVTRSFVAASTPSAPPGSLRSNVLLIVSGIHVIGDSVNFILRGVYLRDITDMSVQ